jgi:hypothetical protein
LCKEHRELHYSAIGDGFADLGLHAVKSAVHRKKLPRHYEAGGPTNNNVDMLIRVVEYGRYCASEDIDVALQMSPIENFGLK